MRGCCMNSNAKSGWLAYLELMRISNNPTVISNTLAGVALAGVSLGDWRVWLLALAFSLFYSAGMVFNDWCDYAIDQRERPERPLPSGRVSRNAALLLTIGLFGIGLACVALVSWQGLLWAGGLVGLIVLYDLWHKTNPISPILMAGTRILVYLSTIAALDAAFSWQVWLAVGLLFSYVMGFTFIAKSELRPQLKALWPAICVLLPIGYALITPDFSPILVSVALLSWSLHSMGLVYRQRQIGPAIGRLIAGISLFDALVCIVAGNLWACAFAIAAFGLTRLAQRSIQGT